jgi:hypothetical protein
MKWEKLGVIFNADRRSQWMHSHAYVPTAYQPDSKRIRVFLAFRDENQVGRIGWIDVAASDPTCVLAVSERPSLDVGCSGAFDDNGVTPLSVVPDGARLRIYYAGWQLTPRARYLLFTGLAFSDDGGSSFVRYQETPVLDRGPKEFLVRSGAYVMQDAENGLWKIWYAASSSLINYAGKETPTYHMAYAESIDGIHWPQSGTVVLKPQGSEFGFGRPHIRKTKGAYELWYSVRSHSQMYRIGYATSEDGLQWVRRDPEGELAPSKSGWDSEMTGFPSIIENDHGTFMFYNGNGFGLTGVGVARLLSN